MESKAKIAIAMCVGFVVAAVGALVEFIASGATLKSFGNHPTAASNLLDYVRHSGSEKKLAPTAATPKLFYFSGTVLARLFPCWHIRCLVCIGRTTNALYRQLDFIFRRIIMKTLTITDQTIKEVSE